MIEIQPGVEVELLTTIKTVVGTVAIFKAKCAIVKRHLVLVTKDFTFLFEGKEVNYAHSIFFDEDYLDTISQSEFKFIIQHELGHLVHNHNFLSDDIDVLLRQECEADTYAIIHSQVGIITAYKVLLGSYRRIVTTNEWSNHELQLLKLDLGNRLINITKTIPFLVRLRYIAAKQALYA